VVALLATIPETTMQRVLSAALQRALSLRVRAAEARWATLLVVLLVGEMPGCSNGDTPARSESVGSGSDAATSPGNEWTSIAPSSVATQTAPAVNHPDEMTTSTHASTTAQVDGDEVRGKVIDYWGHALAGVAVGIGAERTRTNEVGEFVFSGVPSRYDVSLVARFSGEVVEVYGWRYEGLTRRNPTLQVYKGLRQREAQVTFDITGLGEDSVFAEAAMGGVDGHRAYSISSAKESLAAWRGSDAIDASVHAFSFTSAPGVRVPSSYLAHVASHVRLTDGGSSAIKLDLTSTGELATASVSGSVSESRGEDWSQLVFARFDDGPSVLLINEPNERDAPGEFVYSVPKIDGMTLTIAARQDAKVAQGEYSVGYVSGVAPGDGVGAIQLPVPATLTAPEEGVTNVSMDTRFSWHTSAGTSVVVFEDLQIFQAVYVVTTAKDATLPDLSNLGLFHTNRGQYTWTVETHGTATSTDELLTERGFLDPFSGDLNYPMGSSKGQGRFARSSTRTFTAGKVTDSAFAR
jgi:hypothetical protein